MQQHDGVQHRDDVDDDTAAFQAFQDAADYRPEPRRLFRVLTLLVGLVAFAAIAWLLTQ